MTSVPSVQSSAPSIWSLASGPRTRWVTAACDEASERAVRREHNCSPLMARIYAARGLLTAAGLSDSLDASLRSIHDPFLLADMEGAVERIGEAGRKKESVWVFGDYDADGVTSTAILSFTLRRLGIEARTYIPHRMEEGYGLRAAAVEKLASEGADLIITVDNGITANGAVERAAELGIDVIITDHHEPGPELPAARAVINPRRPGCGYPFKDLCGAGVAFKLSHALLRTLDPDPDGAKAWLITLLDLTALGTVADMVSLTGENRVLVRHGLRVLRENARPGLRSLLETAGRWGGEPDASALGWTVGPRINAAGRTQHAGIALELLTTDDPRRARELALQLERFNEDRRGIESEITDQALAKIDEDSEASVLVVAGRGWHPGVVGIVASRLVDRFHRPAVVLAVEDGIARGSARSIEGFDIHAALCGQSERLERFGGHTMAAGLTIRADGIDELRERLDRHGREVMSEDDLVRKIRLDARADAEDLTEANVGAIEAMGPFGTGNERPMLEIRGLNLIEAPRVLKDRHLKLRLAGRDGRAVGAIGFSLGHRAAELDGPTPGLRLAGTLMINEWRGRRSVEIEIKDFALDDPAPAVGGGRAA